MLKQKLNFTICTHFSQQEFKKEVQISEELLHIEQFSTSINPPPRPPPPTPISPQFKELLKDIVLMEGQKCILRANVSGLPNPKITWFKDGVSVIGNTDYKTFFDEDEGTCELVIEETFVADSANWSVRGMYVTILKLNTTNHREVPTLTMK